MDDPMDSMYGGNLDGGWGNNPRNPRFREDYEPPMNEGPLVLSGIFFDPYEVQICPVCGDDFENNIQLQDHMAVEGHVV